MLTGKSRMIAFVGLALLVRFAAPGWSQTLKHVRVYHSESPSIAQQLIDLHFDVLPASITINSFDLIGSDEELILLSQRNYDFEIIAEGKPFRQIQSEQAITAAGVPAEYPDYNEIITILYDTADDFPDICQAVNLTDRYNTPPTVEGRHLFAVKISDHVDQDENEPSCLLVSAHHAREIVTPVVALHVLDQLTTLYGVDPNITALVDENEIWIAPVWNPDGYEYVFNVDNYWRKNRRVFATGVGVDLNRNYSFGWDSPCGGSTYVSYNTYRGPAPASEAETQTMIALVQDRHFAKVNDFHSYAREVRYGNGCLGHPFLSFLESEAASLASLIPGYTENSSCCTGGDIHYHTAYHGSHCFLWETHYQFQPSYLSALAEADLIFPAILAALQRTIPLTGIVTNATTGEPIAAEIQLPDIEFEHGEMNLSESRFGRYYAFLPPGTYSVQFNAEGYYSQTVPVTVSSDSTLTVDVELHSAALYLELLEAPEAPVPAGNESAIVMKITSGAEQLVPGSPTLFYRLEDGPFQSVAMDPCYPQMYQAIFPRVLCGDTPEFYLQAQGDMGTYVTLPEHASTDVFTFPIGSPVVPGDMDGNNFVNLKDFSLFAVFWLDATCPPHQPCACDGADINQDGIVNLLDLLIFSTAWLADLDF
jgi:zinc carboxypeptidase/carboxypeptidase family protein